MPTISYEEWNPSLATLQVIDQARDIIDEMAEDGYILTLRQLYYQFVARDLIPNKQTEYKRLGHILNRARLAGFIDWNSIEDRTRGLKVRNHWDSPEDIIDDCAGDYGKDLWVGQTYRPEVWVEKDALIGVVGRVCNKWDVPFFSCRGYSSQSAMWEAGQRFLDHLNVGDQTPLIIYLGDHDPSGMQMGEDIAKRMETFTGVPDVVVRVALTREQIREHRPPPNPAKQTDSRFTQYVAQHGNKCWELDALHPKVIAETIEHSIRGLVDMRKWRDAYADQESDRGLLVRVARAWDDVEDFVEKRATDEED